MMHFRTCFYFLIFLLFEISSSAGTRPWTVTSIKDPAQLETICDGQDKFTITENEFSLATIYQQGKATVTICHSPKDQLNFLTEEYMILYNLGSQSVPVHMEAGVMAWAADARPVGSDFLIDLYWPADQKQKRKVQELKITCKEKCTSSETCAIERLKTDLPLDSLLALISEKLKNKTKKKAFLNGSASEDTLRLDQLFMEALTGSSKAKKLMDQFFDGNNAAAAEQIGTYLMYVQEMAPLKCHWSEK